MQGQHPPTSPGTQPGHLGAASLLQPAVTCWTHVGFLPSSMPVTLRGVSPPGWHEADEFSSGWRGWGGRRAPGRSLQPCSITVHRRTRLPPLRVPGVQGVGCAAPAPKCSVWQAFSCHRALLGPSQQGHHHGPNRSALGYRSTVLLSCTPVQHRNLCLARRLLRDCFPTATCCEGCAFATLAMKLCSIRATGPG